MMLSRPHARLEYELGSASFSCLDAVEFGNGDRVLGVAGNSVLLDPAEVGQRSSR